MVIKRENVIHLFIASAVIETGISYSKLYLFHVSLILIIAFLIRSFALNNWTFKIKRLPTKFHYLFLLMFAWYGLSINWSINIYYTFQYLFYIFCGSFLSLTIIYYSTDCFKQAKVFKTLAIIFVIDIVFSLLEAFTSFRLPVSPFSIYVGYFGRSGSELSIFSEETLEYLKSVPTGFHWNPNNLATAMSLVFPFFLFYRRKAVKILGSLSTVTLVILINSRSNILAIIFMLFCYLLLFRKQKLLIAILSLPIFASIIALTSDFINDLIPSRIRVVASVFEALKLFIFEEASTNNSIGVRQELMKNGLSALNKTYGLGVGGGGSKAVQEEVGAVAGRVTSMHNFWIEILIEGGVLFAIIFAVWYAYMTYLLYRISRLASDPNIRYFAASSSLALLGFLVAAVSPSSVIYFLAMWILFGFSIATINNYKKSKFCYESIDSCRS